MDDHVSGANSLVSVRLSKEPGPREALPISGPRKIMVQGKTSGFSMAAGVPEARFSPLVATHGWGKPADHRMGMGECWDKLSGCSVAKKVQIPGKPAGFTR